MDFKSFKFHPKVEAGIVAAGYTTPTPIQAQAIVPVMEKKDVMGLAQTGTGKTAAFGLPILHRLMTGKRGQVRALIIAPTRELAEQINEAIKSLGKMTGLRSITVYGGVGINPQKAALKRGVDIVVACPGRLLDHIQQGTIDLSKLEVLVLDEADHMFDMGFLPDIRKILKALPSQRQTLLFSATMPIEIRRLANDILRYPQTIQADTATSATTVRHALYPVAQHLKTDLLLQMLEHTDTDSVLVFTRTKHRAKRLGEKLGKSGYKATSLQGNLSQNRRQEALNGFRQGKYQILVATDIAARGIDVSQVSHVINYDVPTTPEAYVHRIGRTGRAARTGDAYTMVAADDKSMIRSIERLLGKSIEQRTMDGFDYKKAAPPRSAQADRGSQNRGGGGGQRHARPAKSGNSPRPNRNRSGQSQRPGGVRPSGNR
jgi:ATP-dependent RNA helicase RhlE